jgi:hypothetical protein
METVIHVTKASFIQRFKASITKGRVLSGIKQLLKPLVVSASKSVLSCSLVKRSVLAVLNRFPKIKTRLYRVVWKDVTLSPRAMRIYTTLSTTIPTHQAR